MLKDLVEKAEEIHSRCQDYVVPAGEIGVSFFRDGEKNILALQACGREFHVNNDRILSQIAGRVGMPDYYLMKLVGENPELATRCVRHGFKQKTATAKGRDKELKIRGYQVNGHNRLRALVSTRYLSIPSVEIVRKMEEFFGSIELQWRKVHVDEYGLSVTAYVPKGEGAELGMIFPGLAIFNDETGMGAFEVTAALFRLACMNGLVIPLARMGGNFQRKVHLGIGDDGGDVVRALLQGGANSLGRQLEFGLPVIRKAVETKIDIDRFYHGLRKEQCFTTDTLLAIVRGFTGERELGETLWGASNGLTRMARDSRDQRIKDKFERLGGEILYYPEDKVRRLERTGESYIEEMVLKQKGYVSVN